ncbi:alpha/beta fold hydrolase [Liquorilactobacillus mali]|uniref:alpha/beta fold hydrolase n=1 Tax=Liquorilactobacillus mali TaxID=1618 RepID=UPI002953C3BE|nr:alpha/beta fold hydrolase [Liquorilactobacillus mali]MDV7756658.1 alpha/beta hydrolase [Liquorilactobacillus mali]
MGKRLNEPIVFVHGYAGGFWSFFSMIHKLKKRQFISNRIIITVSHKGTVKIRNKKITKDSGIQIIFRNGKQSVEQQGIWLGEIFSKLKADYGIKQLDIIAHSMGAVSALYMLTNLKTKNLPKIKKMVMLGAPFADVEPGADSARVENIQLSGEGVPLRQTNRYKLLKKGSKNLDDGIEVFNIIGDSDSGFSDGKVSISSAKALRYLLEDIGYYREKIVRNRKVNHRRLHEDNNIFKQIIDFLLN